MDGRSKAVVADTVSAFGQVLTILLKIFAGFLLLGLVFMACALIVGAFAVVITPELISPHYIETWIALFGILAVLVPCLLLIYVLMCLIASRRPNGKAIGFTFLGWVVVIFLLIFCALREGIHREVIEELLPAPTYNSHNLMNDPMEAIEEAAEAYEEAIEEASIQIGKAVENGDALLQVTTPEGKIEMKVDEQGLKIDVKEQVK